MYLVVETEWAHAFPARQPLSLENERDGRWAATGNRRSDLDSESTVVRVGEGILGEIITCGCSSCEPYKLMVRYFRALVELDRECATCRVECLRAAVVVLVGSYHQRRSVEIEVPDLDYAERCFEGHYATFFISCEADVTCRAGDIRWDHQHAERLLCRTNPWHGSPLCRFDVLPKANALRSCNI